MKRGLALYVHKARATDPSAPVPDLALCAEDEIPDTPQRTLTPAELGESRQLFVDEAEMIVDVLYESLPGGTLDQMLRLMLERKASQFVVRF